MMIELSSLEAGRVEEEVSPDGKYADEWLHPKKNKVVQLVPAHAPECNHNFGNLYADEWGIGRPPSLRQSKSLSLNPSDQSQARPGHVKASSSEPPQPILRQSSLNSDLVPSLKHVCIVKGAGI